MASQSTRDHQEIQRWAERHGACPTIVSRTGGMLRFEFDPDRANELTPVDWNNFFKVLDEKGLELLYDDKPGSRFHKFVYPETLEAKAEHRAARRPARAGKRLNVVGGRGAVGISNRRGENSESRNERDDHSSSRGTRASVSGESRRTANASTARSRNSRTTEGRSRTTERSSSTSAGRRSKAGTGGKAGRGRTRAGGSRSSGTVQARGKRTNAKGRTSGKKGGSKAA